MPTVPPLLGLPPRFAWYPIDSADRAGALQLRLDGAHVIAVVGISAGRWHLTVNLHRGLDAVRWSYCGSRGQAMRWAERWIRPRALRVADAIARQGAPARTEAPGLSRDEKRQERERRG